jgi:MFS-type transporter involved in bile tolerance (Atg22 family)
MIKSLPPLGCVAVISGGIGTIIGGLLVNKLELKLTGTLKLCIMISIICLCLEFGIFIKCNDLDFAGVTAEYTDYDNRYEQLKKRNF